MHIILWWNCSVPHFYQCTVSHKQIQFIVSLATLKVWNRAQVVRESRFLLYIKKMFNSKGSGMDNYFLRKKEGSWKLALGSSSPIFPPTHTPTQKKWWSVRYHIFQLTCDLSAVHATLHHTSQKWVCLSPHPLFRGLVWPVSLLSLQMVRLINKQQFFGTEIVQNLKSVKNLPSKRPLLTLRFTICFPVVFIKWFIFRTTILQQFYDCLLKVFLFYWFSKELFGRSHFQIMHTWSGFYFANSHMENYRKITSSEENFNVNSPLTFAFLFPWFSVSVHPQNMLRDFAIIVRVHLLKKSNRCLLP